MGARTQRRVLAARLVALGLVVLRPASGQTEGEVDVRPAPEIASARGRPLAAVDVRVAGGAWTRAPRVTRVRPGEPLTAEVARRAMRELYATGTVADVRAYVEELEGAPILVLEVVPRRLVAKVAVRGAPPDVDLLQGPLGFRVDDEVTAYSLRGASDAAERQLAEAGYPSARVVIRPEETDDPLRVLLRVEIVAGEPRRLAQREFQVSPRVTPALEKLLKTYDVDAGDRQDVARLAEADVALEARLVEAGFYDAKVQHRLRGPGVVDVGVEAGPRYQVRFEGNHTFDAERLSEALSLGESDEHDPQVLAVALRRFYENHGFMDAEVVGQTFESPDGTSSELILRVRERAPLRVTSRVYPCLGNAKTPEEVGAEIDGVLAEELPTGGIVEAVSPGILDSTLGPLGQRSDQAEPYRLNPWLTFTPDAYAAAAKHLEEVFQSQGFLDARVGLVTLVRRQCDPRSQPNVCVPLGERPLPKVSCDQLPNEEVFSQEVNRTCTPDPDRGVRCEPTAVVVLPIHPGRQAVLYDVAFEGNVALTEAELLEVGELELGEALSTTALDAARRRIVERYAEEGYAFAEVDTELELSPDHTRAHVRFIVSEREPVYVSRIEIQGAARTRESLIRKRLALEPGDLYRASAVRATQQQVESLGVFASVAVGLEDPSVPAREKVLVVSVNERLPQYVDVRGGYSTGEGFRVGFEYGHRNLGANAVQLVVRVQLGLRPPELIFDPQVRAKYEAEDLQLLELLERRNSVTLTLPDIGLGPRWRLSLEGLDLRDNARDFGLTKDAAFLRLFYQPSREVWLQFGGSVELNEATVFGTQSLEEYVQQNPSFANIVRVPQGQSIAFSQAVGVGWDRRDQALDATRGTFASVGLEHVTAIPVEENERDCAQDDGSAFTAPCSELLRLTNRLAGYVPLNDKGLSLAASFQWGLIHHLTDTSRTYPDRLFFMGGVDTIRGYLQDSLVPEDIAEQLLDPSTGLTIDAVALRGGDVFINPRVELRIPLSSSVSTALFIDSGNLWTDPAAMDPTKLRYAFGTGLRIATPVGPLVFDYGFNAGRVFDLFDPGAPDQRTWESLGAFHFSIGVF